MIVAFISSSAPANRWEKRFLSFSFLIVFICVTTKLLIFLQVIDGGEALNRNDSYRYSYSGEVPVLYWLVQGAGNRAAGLCTLPWHFTWRSCWERIHKRWEIWGSGLSEESCRLLSNFRWSVMEGERMNTLVLLLDVTPYGSSIKKTKPRSGVG